MNDRFYLIDALGSYSERQQIISKLNDTHYTHSERKHHDFYDQLHKGLLIILMSVCIFIA